MAEENQEVGGQVSVISQFVRDMSFVNLAAKERRNPNGAPAINVSVNVDPKQLVDQRYEVGLSIHAKATIEDQEIFSCFLDYVGIFDVSGVKPELVTPVLSIECPRLLFPFVRRIVGETTREGGYPPLMLDPIDFAGLFRQRVAQAAAAAPNGEA